MTNLYAAPVYKLKELNNIFIEMTAKNCNYKCKNCYIDFGFNKAPKDFISIDKIKEMLISLENALLTLAKEHLDTIMPGYTHLQKA